MGEHRPPDGLAASFSSESSSTVSFAAMAEGTAEDYRILAGHEAEHAAGLPDRILGQLGALDGSFGGYRISRLDHSLQTATRARHDGADVEWVVAALVHDIGDLLAPHNHGELAAAVLQPYVSAEVHWVVLHHGVFQLYHYGHHVGLDPDERERFRHHPWFDRCAEFCRRWDQASFDPDFATDDLASFEADVRRVFTRPAWDPAFTGR